MESAKICWIDVLSVFHKSIRRWMMGLLSTNAITESLMSVSVATTPPLSLMP